MICFNSKLIQPYGTELALLC